MTGEERLLDHGYLRLVETWGSDERIVEAARMSTDKGFLGWGPVPCPRCRDSEHRGTVWQDEAMVQCPRCKGTEQVPGDEGLLSYLMRNRHTTPFEMGGMVVEVQAPIFVFREWHRHRTQSYNELSARYTPLPDVNYLPTVERCLMGGGANKQAQSATGRAVTAEQAEVWLLQLREANAWAQAVYQNGLDWGIPKEVARLPVPVNRYSRMRASANLWNWLHFLTLRMDEHAQWEIRQYANAVGRLVEQAFPRTWALYVAGAR